MCSFSSSVLFLHPVPPLCSATACSPRSLSPSLPLSPHLSIVLCSRNSGWGGRGTEPWLTNLYTAVELASLAALERCRAVPGLAWRSLGRDAALLPAGDEGIHAYVRCGPDSDGVDVRARMHGEYVEDPATGECNSFSFSAFCCVSTVLTACFLYISFANEAVRQSHRLGELRAARPAGHRGGGRRSERRWDASGEDRAGRGDGPTEYLGRRG